MICNCSRKKCLLIGVGAVLAAAAFISLFYNDLELDKRLSALEEHLGMMSEGVEDIVFFTDSNKASQAEQPDLLGLIIQQETLETTAPSTPDMPLDPDAAFPNGNDDAAIPDNTPAEPQGNVEPVPADEAESGARVPIQTPREDMNAPAPTDMTDPLDVGTQPPFGQNKP